MAENPSLRQLGIRIDSNEEVKPSDVEHAYKEEVKLIKEKFAKLGKKEDSAEVKRYMERLAVIRDRLLKQLENLKKAREKARGKVTTETSVLRKRLQREIQLSLSLRQEIDAAERDDTKRRTLLNSALKKTEHMTDPDAEGAAIPDYEGYSVFGSGLSDENFNNPTRWTLSGWLTAFQLHGDKYASEQLKKAADIYEHSDSTWGRVDAVLYYDDMLAGMDMKKHIDEIRGRLKLASQSEGFVAGYLAFATANMEKEEAAAYKEYIFQTLRDWSGELEFKGKGIDEDHLDYFTGHHQMNVLASLLSPKEWAEKKKEMAAEFVRVQQQAEQLAKALNFNYKNVEIRLFLERKKESVTSGDRKEIDRMKDLIKKEGYDALKPLKKELEDIHKDVDKKAEAVIERNKKLKHFEEKEMDVLRDRVKFARENIDKISATPDDPMEEMLESAKQVDTAANYMKDSVLPMIEEMDKKLDDVEKQKEEEEKRKKEEEEEKKKAAARAKAAAGAGAAGAGRKPAEKREAKEQKESLAEFLKEKHLREQEVGDRYLYALDYPALEVTSEGIFLRFKNPEVAGAVEKQFNDYMNALLKEKLGEKRLKEELDVLKQRSDLTLESFLTYAGSYQPKKEEKGRMDAVANVFSRAMNNSSMWFEKRPSRAELQAEYDKKFVPAWKSAGKELETALGKGPRPKEKSERVNVGPELNFLDEVTLEYVDAMSKLALHGNDPEGVVVELPQQPNYKITCRFRRQPDGYYMLMYSGGSVRYPRIEHAIREINAGLVHQRVMHQMLADERYYEKYEDAVGALDKNEKGRTPGEIALELDWNNPDPDIYVRALPHGRVVYTIARENVGPYGENYRSMWADSFEDFMNQLRHVRQWAEGKKHAHRESPSASKEILFDVITNPFNYRNKKVESQIGRVIHFEIFDNELVQLHLDWGGGNNRLSPRNAMLNIWVTRRGGLMFILNGPGDADIVRKEASSFNEIISQVEAMKRRV